MTAFFKGKAVGQTDAILVDGQLFGEKQIKEILKDIKAESKPTTKRKK